MQADKQYRSETDTGTLGAISVISRPSGTTVEKKPEGRSAFRLPQQLRLHRALIQSGWTGRIDELNDSARANQSAHEPILITTNDTILAGFGRWRAAILDGSEAVECIQYSLSDDEALQFILAHHYPQPGWNDFIRICLALNLELYFQKKALDNLRAGGKYKGSATLPQVRPIDVRHEIAQVAGVGDRNVSKVKEILKSAHPRLIDALRDTSLSINRALQWCGLPKGEQLKRFIDYRMERATDKTIRRYIKEDNVCHKALEVLNTLRQQEARAPGSVLVRTSQNKQTVVVVGRDVIANASPRSEAKTL